MSSYKEEHQRFMTGHTGTSFIQLVWMLGSISVSCALRDAIVLWGADTFRRSLSLRFIADFLIIVIPSLLNITLLNNSVFSTFICLTVTTLLLFFTYMNKRGPKSVSSLLYNANLDQEKTFITYFRSVVLLMTALAIIAVDFQVFPRKLAKTEVFGFGMMDFGVGFFVVSNAIVSPEARKKEIHQPIFKKLRTACFSSIPLLVLAFVRLVSIKGTNYQEHVTEYGVHWNFFFTLAALKIVSAPMFSMMSTIKLQPGIFGILVLCCHQIFLSTGLSDYIIVGADGKGGRSSLVDSNREGIFSLPGYVALYMMSIQLGKFFFQKRSNLWDWLRAALYLFVAVIGFACITEGLQITVQPVSRRFVNAAYVLSTMGFSCVSLSICLIGDIGKSSITSLNQREKGKSKPIHASNSRVKESEPESTDISVDKRTRNVKELCLMKAISFNSLLAFLLANLMTGLINMSVATIYASTITSMSILCLYAFILCAVCVLLYSKNLKTKIW